MIDTFLVTFPTFTYAGQAINKITIIKAIRTLCGMGLKEAKDSAETYGQQSLRIDLRNSIISVGSEDVFIEEQFRILRNEGCEIGPSVNLILQQLRDLGAAALKQGEDELANEILQLVLAEKLRRKQ